MPPHLTVAQCFVPDDGGTAIHCHSQTQYCVFLWNSTRTKMVTSVNVVALCTVCTRWGGGGGGGGSLAVQW